MRSATRALTLLSVLAISWMTIAAAQQPPRQTAPAVSGKKLALGNAALMAFTRALGSESVDHGVRAVGVNPGRIETERQILRMKEQAIKEFNDVSRWPEIQAKVAAALPFKRAGRPEEVGDLVAYLASARASYISGTIVTIDCGASLRPRS